MLRRWKGLHPWVILLGRPVWGLGNDSRLYPALGNLLEARPWLSARTWAPSGSEWS